MPLTQNLEPGAEGFRQFGSCLDYTGRACLRKMNKQKFKMHLSSMAHFCVLEVYGLEK